jgi:hypothetical protein
LYKISLRCSLVRLFTKSAKSCRFSGLITTIIRPPRGEVVGVSGLIICSGRKTPIHFLDWSF